MINFADDEELFPSKKLDKSINEYLKKFSHLKDESKDYSSQSSNEPKVTIIKSHSRKKNDTSATDNKKCTCGKKSIEEFTDREIIMEVIRRDLHIPD